MKYNHSILKSSAAENHLFSFKPDIDFNYFHLFQPLLFLVEILKLSSF